MPRSYKSQYPPGVPVDPEIVHFFEKFYETSDTPGAHEQYVDLFTEDATFILASKTAHGRGEITTARHGMWAAVASRKHKVPKIFPFGGSSLHFMLYGTVELGLKNGAQADVEWAGRAEVVKSPGDGRWRMKFYQVYLVSNKLGSDVSHCDGAAYQR